MKLIRNGAIIFVLSVLPHLYGITSPALDYHYHRQVNTAAIAYNFYQDGLPFFHPRITWNGNDNKVAATEFPAYMWLLGLIWGIFGLGEMWGRILSVFLSATTAVVLYRFLARWMEDGAAFWGAILFSFLPIEIYFGRTIQPESLALLCCAVALWSFDRYLSNDPPKYFWGLCCSVCAGVAVGLKLPYAHLWLILAMLAVWRKGWSAARDPGIWLLFILSTIPAAAWYHYTASAAIPESGREVLPTSLGSMLQLLDYTKHLRILAYYSSYQVISRFPELTTTYTGLVLFGVGARFFYLRRQWFPFFWWGAVLLHLIVGGGYTFLHEYTALPFALVNAAFLGEGFWQWRTRALSLSRNKRIRSIALLAVLVIGIPVHAALRIAVGPRSGHWYHINYPFLLTLKPVIDKLSGPDDLFFCNNRASSVYLFYIGRRGWSWDLDEIGEHYLYRLDATTRQGAKFLLTEKTGVFKTRSGPIASHIFNNFPIAYEDKDVLIFKLHPVGKSGA